MGGCQSLVAVGSLRSPHGCMVWTLDSIQLDSERLKPGIYIQGFFVLCLADSVQKIRIQDRIASHVKAEIKIFSGEGVVLFSVHRSTTYAGSHIQNPGVIVIYHKGPISEHALQKIQPLPFVIGVPHCIDLRRLAPKVSGKAITAGDKFYPLETGTAQEKVIALRH